MEVWPFSATYWLIEAISRFTPRNLREAKPKTTTPSRIRGRFRPRHGKTMPKTATISAFNLAWLPPHITQGQIHRQHSNRRDPEQKTDVEQDRKQPEHAEPTGEPELFRP